jgi:hypothetical protein
MEFYSAIRKNETMWLEDKQMELEDIMLSKISQLSLMCKTDLKEKCIHKSKHDYIHIYM